MDSLAHTPGIYRIVCNPTHRVYIGSSADVLKRCRCHKRQLELGKHYNAFLQRAWNKYGEAAFSFELVETSPIDDLLSREQFWIDQCKSYCTRKGFNYSPRASAPSLGRRLTESTRKKMSHNNKGENNPNYRGHINICAYCGKQFKPQGRLTQKYCSHECYAKAPKTAEQRYKMGNATRGKHRTVVSLAKYFKSRALWYVFTDPNGVEIVAQGLQKFCYEHGLDQPSMSAVIRGKRRHCKGWRCRKCEQPN